MSVIAVAGGTGGVGRAIVDALKATGKYEVVVLSRKVCGTHHPLKPHALSIVKDTEHLTIEQSIKEKEEEIGARIIAIDYEDLSSLTKILEEEKIWTLISTLDTNAGAEPEQALIRAADKSSVTKRYIPSIWGAPYDEEYSSSPFLPAAPLKS